MYQLIYKSTCRDDVGLDELRRIGRESAARNRANGISGVMLVEGCDILQIIEGDKAAVTDLYERIMMDHRHFSCTKLLTRHAETRAFPQWHMAVCEVDKDDADLFRLAVSTIKARRRQRDKLAKRSAA